MFKLQTALKISLKHSYSDIFFVFELKINKKHMNSTKKVENGKQVYQPSFRCCAHPNAGRNTQQATFICTCTVYLKG